jgi:Glutamine amidotransferases class-II
MLQVVSFYEFYEGLQEGWDGPALLVFSDGEKIGARLDRNGLRPARFWATNDGYIYVASEVGQDRVLHVHFVDTILALMLARVTLRSAAGCVVCSHRGQRYREVPGNRRGIQQ